MFAVLGFIFWSILCTGAGFCFALYISTHSKKVKKFVDDEYAKAEATGDLLGADTE